MQWKPGESIELVVFVEQHGVLAKPRFTVLDRAIIDGEVSYSTLSQPLTLRRNVADRIPVVLRELLRWVGIVFFSLLALIVPWGLFTEKREKSRFKRWLVHNEARYRTWVDTLLKDSKLSQYVPPNKLPPYLWPQYPGPKPKVPDAKGLVAAVVISLLLASAIPLLWLIEL